MEPTVIIAVIGGAFATIGTIAQVISKFKEGEQTRRSTDNQRMDDKAYKWIELVEKQRDAAFARMEKMETDNKARITVLEDDAVTRQRLYLDVLERLDSSEESRRRAGIRIEELTSTIQELTAKIHTIQEGRA